MKLMSLSQFKAHYFDKRNQPTEATLRKWIENGDLKGRKLGGKWYIDSRSFEMQDNELVSQVLRA